MSRQAKRRNSPWRRRGAAWRCRRTSRPARDVCGADVAAAHEANVAAARARARANSRTESSPADILATTNPPKARRRLRPFPESLAIRSPRTEKWPGEYIPLRRVSERFDRDEIPSRWLRRIRAGRPLRWPRAGRSRPPGESNRASVRCGENARCSRGMPSGSRAASTAAASAAEFRAGFDAGPEHARAALVGEKSQAAKNDVNGGAGSDTRPARL